MIDRLAATATSAEPVEADAGAVRSAIEHAARQVATTEPTRAPDDQTRRARGPRRPRPSRLPEPVDDGPGRWTASAAPPAVVASAAAAKPPQGAPADKRTKKLIGLKIGASQIAAAQRREQRRAELVEVFREPLEPGLVVSGEIRDPDALGDALKRFFELHKLPKSGIRLGLSNNRIGVRVFEIDGRRGCAQLENAIRFRAEEVLPIPLDQAVLDYVVLERATCARTGRRRSRILLVVAYREVVDRYLQACDAPGSQVVGIDLEAFALLRSLEPPTDRDVSAGALVGVAIGHDRTTIAVSTGRYCEFARVLDWGGWSLNVAIARELDARRARSRRSSDSSRSREETEVDGLTPEQVAKDADGIQRALATFARELVSSLQFYQAQPGALGIGEIVADGRDGAYGRLPRSSRASSSGCPSVCGDPFKRVKLGTNVTRHGPAGSLAIAIGLGIED